MLVLDCSIAIAWVLPDEDDALAMEAFDVVRAEGAMVPALWRLEVANTLLMAERRGRIDQAFRVAALADLRQLPIHVDAFTAQRSWDEIIVLAEAYRLTAYDAAYLELAYRTGAVLASLDRDLCRAAQSLGVAILES